MFASLIRFTSRTTYRGSKGSGAGQSGKTNSKSSPFSKPTLVKAVQEGRILKRSQRGLYDGAVLQSGNNLPKSRQKTKRTFSPNVQKSKRFSSILNKMIQFKMTTRAMRTIEKLGGLDNYLVRTKDETLGKFGRDLREKLIEKVRKDDRSLLLSRNSVGINSSGNRNSL